jgi:hypothetical protein
MIMAGLLQLRIVRATYQALLLLSLAFSPSLFSLPSSLAFYA